MLNWKKLRNRITAVLVRLYGDGRVLGIRTMQMHCMSIAIATPLIVILILVLLLMLI